MDDGNILEAEKDFEIRALTAEVEKLRNELTKYKILLKEVDEDINPDVITDEEVICVREISKLKKITEERDLSTDEVKKFDMLHKNLKLARGETSRIGSKSKVSKMSQEELERLAKE
jgi:hypothetical protein